MTASRPTQTVGVSEAGCGWLDRKLIEGDVTFWLSDRGVTVLELGVPLAEAQRRRTESATPTARRLRGLRPT